MNRTLFECPKCGHGQDESLLVGSITHPHRRRVRCDKCEYDYYQDGIRVPIEQVVGRYKSGIPDSLRASIQERGIVNPLIVQEANPGSIYRIIVGNQRWTVAKQLGIEVVPVAVVRQQGTQEMTDAEVLKIHATYEVIEGLL